MSAARRARVFREWDPRARPRRGTQQHTALTVLWAVWRVGQATATAADVAGFTAKLEPARRLNECQAAAAMSGLKAAGLARHVAVRTYVYDPQPVREVTA